MLGYRLYVLNDAGHIVDALEALYETDAEAVAWAGQQLDGKDLELWSGARVVIKIPKSN